MAPIGAKKAEDKTTADVVNDLWQLVRDYAKQETVDPLKTIGRFLALGLGGAVLLSLGVVMGVLAILRGLQTSGRHHLDEHLSWVPYLWTFLLASAVLAFSIRTITKPNRTDSAPS